MLPYQPSRLFLRLKIHHLKDTHRFFYASINNYKTQHELVEIKQEIDHKFIPMTRRTLIRKVLEQEYLIRNDEKEQYSSLIDGLETALSHNFHGVLSELKQLYDPLNPDKETMIAHHFGAKERLDNEYKLLQKVDVQLKNASFQELSRQHIASALSEHPVYEGVLVHVDMKDYDVLRFWVLSEDTQPLQSSNLLQKIRNYVYVWLKKWPKNIKTYKRVVLAVRTKKQNKLMLKSFKDIPQNGLEYFLPEGKITMSKYDRGLIGTTVSIGVLSILIKLVSYLNDIQVSWTYAVGGVTGLLALKSWNAYKNKRNNYLVNLSKSLYFKSIANNRALLTVIVDRAEDEIFKSALLAYSFIRAENKLKALSNEEKGQPKFPVTVKELKVAVDSWLKHRYNVEIDYDPQIALKQLEETGLLKVNRLGTDVHLTVPSIEEALQILPDMKAGGNIFLIDNVSNREEDLDVEDIYPENDLEIMDCQQKRKQVKAENSSTGWK